MKNVLIFINDSLGELDWIAPFISSKDAKEFNFYIYLYGFGNTYAEKLDIIKKYSLIDNNIQLLNRNIQIDLYFFKFDNFINRGLNYIKKYSFHGFIFLRKLSDIFRFAIGFLYKSNKIKFDFIFRDYNLKDSFLLNCYLLSNKKAKIIIFPHSVGLQKKHSECPREPIKKVKADLWLENSVESNLALEVEEYKNIFFASGSPSMGENYLKSSLFDVKSNNILILTRVCIKEYGFSYNEALNVFEKLLLKLEKSSLKVFIKHHPRDQKLEEWRNIQNKFSNIEEYDNSLNQIEITLKVCFTLFSSAPLFLLSRKVPIIEISPYKNCTKYTDKMPFHFCDKQGLLTHDFINLGLFYRMDNLNNINKILDNENLNTLSKEQFIKCKKTFPGNANSKIYMKLKEIQNV